jgi:hypothetical protein
MPDNPDIRFLFGYALGRLFRLGAPRDVLLRHVDAVLDMLSAGDGQSS